MTYFDQYSNSPDPAIQHAADLLEDATTKYKSGLISKDEFTELSGDILDFQTISANINDMIRKQEIYDAYQSLSQIVTTILSL